MKASEIKVGGTYKAKVNGKVVTVRVDAIKERWVSKGAGLSYDVTNLTTGRKTTFKSAAKFRSEATNAGEAARKIRETVKTGGEQRPDLIKHLEETTDIVLFECDEEIERFTTIAHAKQYVQDANDGELQEWTRNGQGKERWMECNGGQFKIKSLPKKEGEQSDPFAASGGMKLLDATDGTNLIEYKTATSSLSAEIGWAARTSSCPPSSPVAAAAKPAAQPVTLAGRFFNREKAVDNSPHLIVEARAGTGKTTTLVAGLQRLKGMTPTDARGNPITPSPQQAAVWDELVKSPASSSVTFVAFNKSIATELQQRVPPGCQAMTMHSLGYRAVTKALGRMEPTEWAVQDLIADLCGMDARQMKRQRPVVLKATEQLVSLCKMNLVGINRDREMLDRSHKEWTEDLDRLASHYDVDLNGSRREVFELVPQVLDRCRDPKGRITYDDMIWLPVVLKLPVMRSDLLLVDEAQDLNRCQQALAKMAGQRLILCGDPRQAIYGFAGADNESMSRMEKELSLDLNGHPPSVVGSPAPGRGCTHLPLTVTRRCGKAIVREAQRWVVDFEAHEDNPEGKISSARYPFDANKQERPWETTYAALAGPGDMVLCRTNAPLVQNCFRFLKRGVKANIQGRDVGAGLISTVRKLSGEFSIPVAQFVGKLDDWLAAEQTKENAKHNPSEARLTALADRHDCLTCFADGATTTDDVIRKIETVFTDDKTSPGIKLSSIHKAKGLEARRVFWLKPPGGGMREDKMQPWELEQEDNLRYVATTRAIEELCHVS